MFRLLVGIALAAASYIVVKSRQHRNKNSPEKESQTQPDAKDAIAPANGVTTKYNALKEITSRLKNASLDLDKKQHELQEAEVALEESVVRIVELEKKMAVLEAGIASTSPTKITALAHSTDTATLVSSEGGKKAGGKKDKKKGGGVLFSRIRPTAKAQ